MNWFKTDGGSFAREVNSRFEELEADLSYEIRVLERRVEQIEEKLAEETARQIIALFDRRSPALFQMALKAVTEEQLKPRNLFSEAKPFPPFSRALYDELRLQEQTKSDQDSAQDEQ